MRYPSPSPDPVHSISSGSTRVVSPVSYHVTIIARLMHPQPQPPCTIRDHIQLHPCHIIRDLPPHNNTPQSLAPGQELPSRLLFARCTSYYSSLRHNL